VGRGNCAVYTEKKKIKVNNLFLLGENQLKLEALLRLLSPLCYGEKETFGFLGEEDVLLSSSEEEKKGKSVHR